MTKLEQVIKALQLCRYDPDPGQECKFLVSCDICPYWKDEVGCREIDLFNDALELLKAQEARVLTLEEVRERKPFHLWAEDTETGAQLFPVAYIDGDYIDVSLDWCTNPDVDDEMYGKVWRFWDKKPTNEQRQAVKWDDQ